MIIRILLIVFTLIGFPLPVHGQNQNLLAIANPYLKVLRKYTKEGSVYSLQDIDTRFKWFATYHSPEFQNAFQKYFDKWYPEGQEGYAQKLKSLLQAPGQTLFIVSLYAKPNSLKDMDQFKNLWDLSLMVKGEALKPLIVEEIPLTSFQARFYPYVTKWYRTFRVIFPYDWNNAPVNEVNLLLTSVGGTSRLKFKKVN